MHLHSDLSNPTTIDSTTNFKEYIKLASQMKHPAIAFSEHGNIYNWTTKKIAAEAAGLKYIHGLEAYVTPALTKERESYHMGLYAKNIDGVRELNTLVSKSFNKDDGHFYYTPRMSIDEVMNTSDNIIVTTACLSGLFWRGAKNGRSELLQTFLSWMIENKDRCFLEVQYHNSSDQKQYNRVLADISEETGIPLIAGTDTHSASYYDAECRKILQSAKNMEYGDEDAFDLVFKSGDDLYEAFLTQGALTSSEILSAISNTLLFADMVEPFDLDYTFKYPDMYDCPEEMLKEEIERFLQQKINSGAIPLGRIHTYRKQINIEYDAYVKQEMCSYILFVSELCNWCWSENIPMGFSRGSVAGSLIAYVLNITDVDPIVWNTVFSRFCNSERVSLADIDLDFKGSDRPRVFDYIINRFGIEKVSYIITFNTVADKGAIDEICRAQNIDLDDAKIIKEVYESSPDKAIERYPEVFKYFDGIRGTIISKGVHPAGMIGSPITLYDNLSTIRDDDNMPISSCDMKAVDNLNYVKFDILGLKNIGILKDVFSYLGIPYQKAFQIDWNDQAVWDDMLSSPVGIFQFESEYAFGNLKEFKPRSIRDMALVTAFMRPSGASYRHRIMNRIFNKNPSIEIDELLKDNYGYLVFQEDVISFLVNICQFSQGEADTARRGIGKKDRAIIDKLLPEITQGYIDHTGKNPTVGAQEAKAFVKIIEDASDYMFGFNHSIGYCLIGYVICYYRYYYPLEFITALLNNADCEDDFVAGSHLAKEKNITLKPIQFRHSRGEYFYNKEENCIYKGVGSIKFLNSAKGEELYRLRENNYNSFIDLYKDISTKTSLNKRDIEILILLDYFREFGYNGTLLELMKYIDKLYGRKQIRIDKSISIWDDRQLWLKHSRMTKSLYKDFDYMKFLESVQKSLYSKKIHAYERILAEQEYCGEPVSTFIDIADNVVFVSKVDHSYNVFLKLYKLRTGEFVSIKLQRKTFELNPIKVGDVIVINSIDEKHKHRKENGKWVRLDSTELILSSYTIFSDINLDDCA